MGFLHGEVSPFIQEQINWSPWSVLTEKPARALPSGLFTQKGSLSFRGSMFMDFRFAFPTMALGSLLDEFSSFAGFRHSLLLFLQPF